MYVSIFVYSHPGVDRIQGFSKMKKTTLQTHRQNMVDEPVLEWTEGCKPPPRNPYFVYGVKIDGIFLPKFFTNYILSTPRLQDGYVLIYVDIYMHIFTCTSVPCVHIRISTYTCQCLFTCICICIHTHTCMVRLTLEAASCA